MQSSKKQDKTSSRGVPASRTCAKSSHWLLEMISEEIALAEVRLLEQQMPQSPEIEAPPAGPGPASAEPAATDLPGGTGASAGMPGGTGASAGMPGGTGASAGMPGGTGASAGMPGGTGASAGMPGGDMGAPGGTGASAGMPGGDMGAPGEDPTGGMDPGKDSGSDDEQSIEDFVKDLSAKTVVDIKKTLLADLQSGNKREQAEELISNVEFPPEDDLEPTPENIKQAVEYIRRTFNFKVPKKAAEMESGLVEYLEKR